MESLFAFLPSVRNSLLVSSGCHLHQIRGICVARGRRKIPVLLCNPDQFFPLEGMNAAEADCALTAFDSLQRK
jgi:hypothetical protein